MNAISHFTGVKEDEGEKEQRRRAVEPSASVPFSCPPSSSSSPVKMRNIVFCGGGTGGHVLPGLAVAARLRELGVQHIRWIGDPQRIEATLVPGAGIPLLPTGLPRPRLTSPGWWWAAGRCAVGVTWELLRRRPAVVVALGGYAALLPGLIAPWLRIPLVVMEQNAHAGRTNRLLAKRARAVATQFPEAAKLLPAGRVHMLGNPVRAISAKVRGQGETLTVVVMGGSLSAKSLNDLVLAAAPALAAIPGLRIVHLAGDADAERARATWAAAGVAAEVHGFWQDMPGLYERTDLALTRSGATTVAELCCAGIGALYVPLPWAAEDHQTANAQAVVAVGGAIVLPQATATPALLAGHLARLADDRAAVAALGAGAQRLARPSAADDVARLVLAASRGPVPAGFPT